MAGELARRGDLRACGGRRHASEGEEHFGGDWAGAQDLDRVALHRDDSRFDSMRRRAGIDDSGNAALELRHYMRGGRGRDAAKTICAGRGERFPEAVEHRLKHRMRAVPHRDTGQARCGDVRNEIAFWQNKSERSRPKIFNQPPHKLLALS